MSAINKANWTIDPGHTNIQFSIRHLAITTVRGSFTKFGGEVFTKSDDFDGAEIKFSIETASIDTRHPDRDGHLKSADFFDVAAFPSILFQGVLHKAKEDYELVGDLTAKDITKAISLKTQFDGIAKGRFGDIRAGFEVEGKIDRKDFGLGWNILSEGGGLVLGDDVKLNFTIQLLKAKEV